MQNQIAGQSATPYLMLVTFGAPCFDDFTKEQLAALNNWPYDGVASWLIDAYNAEPVPTPGSLGKATRAATANGGGKIWPWVFFNRMVAQSEEKSHVSTGPKNYFSRINAIDLDDKTGALSDFLEIWRLALATAKEVGAPGVAGDLPPEATDRWRRWCRSQVVHGQGDERAGLGEDVARVCPSVHSLLGIPGQVSHESLLEPPSSYLRSLRVRLCRGDTDSVETQVSSNGLDVIL